MGMPIHMILYSTDPAQARLAAKTAFDRIRALNLILSDYEDESELNRLRSTSGFSDGMRVSDELWFVLNRANKLAKQTSGAFDVTAGPVIQLWKRARRQRALPDPERLTEAMTRTGYYYLEFQPANRTVILWREGMRLDLGGIAKGYAMDQAMEVLRQHGIRRALISGGGDMVATGAPPGKAGWRIELPSLESDDSSEQRFILLRNNALATSGDRFQSVTIDGTRYSHIVDPRSGIGLTDHRLVYVVAKDGTTADSLATAVSVIDPEAGLNLLSNYDAEARMLRRQSGNLQIVESKNFGKHLWPKKYTADESTLW